MFAFSIAGLAFALVLGCGSGNAAVKGPANEVRPVNANTEQKVFTYTYWGSEPSESNQQELQMLLDAGWKIVDTQIAATTKVTGGGYTIPADNNGGIFGNRPAQYIPPRTNREVTVIHILERSRAN